MLHLLLKPSLTTNMKSLLLIPFLLLGSLPAEAGPGHRHSSHVKCFKKVYREKYVPGTKFSKGYVNSWTQTVEVPCRRKRRKHHHHHSGKPAVKPSKAAKPAPTDDNSCVEGAIIGGISGGAAGGVLSTKENWIWSIPLGVVGGSMIGCQIDGG